MWISSPCERGVFGNVGVDGLTVCVSRSLAKLAVIPYVYKFSCNIYFANGLRVTINFFVILFLQNATLPEDFDICVCLQSAQQSKKY